MSSEDFDNADDYADQLGELEEKSDRLADDINDQLSEISSSMASTD